MILVLMHSVQSTVWNFDSDEVGKIAPGFTQNSGEWKVITDNAAPSSPNVLAQTGNSTYNLALVNNSSYQDIDISVKVKAVSGGTDKGGGFVWRAKDDKNYYVIRYNPGETFQPIDVRKMINGTRTMIGKVDNLTCDNSWHTVRVTMKADKIIVFFDDKQILEATDSQFPNTGMVGLWSKANAVSNFDDFTAISLSTGLQSNSKKSSTSFFSINRSDRSTLHQTNFTYYLEFPTAVSFSVFDMSGKQHALLIDGKKQAGSHFTVWNHQNGQGQELPQGKYLVTCYAGGRSETIPVTLIK